MPEIKSSEQIRDLIKDYEKGSNIEYMIDRFGYESKDVFKIVFNYRFAFKKPDEFTNEELWDLLQKEVPCMQEVRREQN